MSIIGKQYICSRNSTLDKNDRSTLSTNITVIDTPLNVAKNVTKNKLVNKKAPAYTGAFLKLSVKFKGI